jgi:hypothetical protein
MLILLCYVVGLINVKLPIPWIDSSVYNVYFVPYFETQPNLSVVNVRKRNILCAL